MLKFDGVTIPAVVSVACGLRSEWDALRGIIDSGILIIETDTCSIKFTNGIHTYAELPYLRVENISAEMKFMLAPIVHIGGRDEGKAVLLAADGKIDDRLIYWYAAYGTGQLRFVDDMVMLNNTGLGDRAEAIYYVIDATDDPTVTAGSAVYVWYRESPEWGVASQGDKWVKIAEFESIDLDINTHIHKTYGSIDAVSDGTDYVRISKSDHDQFLDLKNTSVVTGTNKVYLVNSLTDADFTSTP